MSVSRIMKQTGIYGGEISYLNHRSLSRCWAAVCQTKHLENCRNTCVAQGAERLFCLWLDYPDSNPPSGSFLTAKNKEGGESWPVGGPSRLAIFKH